MDEIIRFVSLVKTDRYSFTELCDQFGVSWKTGYKHLERYEEEGAGRIAAAQSSAANFSAAHRLGSAEQERRHVLTFDKSL